MIFFTSFDCISCECPKAELLNPCKCSDNSIQCGGNGYLDLKHIFWNLSQKLANDEKHFKLIYLNNTAITELEENTFYGLNFDEIYIENAPKLKLIHTNAFTTNNLVTKKFRIYNTPVGNSPPNHNLFLTLSLLSNVEFIDLKNISIEEIPDKAFGPSVQNKLSLFSIENSGLKKIGKHAFSHMNNLNYLSLKNNKIEWIRANAFSFDQFSIEKITILLRGNPLNGSSFELGAFDDMKRPAVIEFRWDKDYENQIKFLDKKIFLPFLESNYNNSVNLGDIKLDCDDCQNYWLRNSKIVKRFDYLNCMNGKLFEDKTNFAVCNQ